jgi:serine/threonine-protein kinase
MIGARLGPYVIDQELGRGGMGRVFLAHEEPGGNLAAVKVLAPELAQDTGFLQRFQREIEALSQLDHPNIVHFFQAGFQDGHYYYAMEYIKGLSFEELLHQEGRLAWAEVLDAALQVCPALKHAHDRGIIHRDIKPPNLLRTPGGAVKLMDFGIAKVFASTRLTATGGIVGTAEYLSPEQAAGKPVTKRSDLYSLGVVMYTLLTGRTPFVGESVLDLLHKHRFGQFDRPQKLVPEIPYELDEVVCLLLEKDPGDRPADGAVLQRILDSIRRKQERRLGPTMATNPREPTLAYNQENGGSRERAEGPATLMSRLVRKELEQQNRGGPIQQFLNRPWVLVTLFVLCVGVIVWAFWLRDDAEPKMNDADQEKGSHVSEAERIYRLGLRHQRDGNLGAAQKEWENVVAIFDGVKSERSWVLKAKNGLAELNEGANAKRWDSVRAALRRARKLRDEASDLRADRRIAESKRKQAQAEKIWRGIEERYAGDPSAAEILREMRRVRGH